MAERAPSQRAARLHACIRVCSAELLLHARTHGCLPAPAPAPAHAYPQVSIINDGPLKELRIFTDFGRTSRPLYIVEDMKLRIKKHHILALMNGHDEHGEEYRWTNVVKDGLVE